MLAVRTEPHRYVISVLAQDKVGVLREVTSALAEMEANIDGISHTVVAGYISLILTATLPRPLASVELQDRLVSRFQEGDVSILVRDFEPVPQPPEARRTDAYVVTIAGQDRVGLLRTVTTFLASKNIAVTDWYVDFHGDYVTHIGEVRVPTLLDVQQAGQELRQLLAPLGLRSMLQHQNLFRVTNEVSPVAAWLRKESHA